MNGQTWFLAESIEQRVSVTKEQTGNICDSRKTTRRFQFSELVIVSFTVYQNCSISI